MQVLRRDYLPAELASQANAAAVTGTIAVQARQTLEETRWLLALADVNPLIRGVVGWAPIAAPDFPDTLAALTHPLLKGLRHIVQAEPPGFFDDIAFNRGISHLLPAGLVYDLLIVDRQLPETIRFVDRHPNQQFVLDHIAKPRIATGAGFDQWSSNLAELARRPNVACKLSGLVTEADWRHWSPAGLFPYFETAINAFTPARLMAGSDWPVLTLASTYSQWWQTLDAWLAPLTPAERDSINSHTAASIYRIPLEPQLPAG